MSACFLCASDVRPELKPGVVRHLDRARPVHEQEQAGGEPKKQMGIAENPVHVHLVSAYNSRNAPEPAANETCAQRYPGREASHSHTPEPDIKFSAQMANSLYQLQSRSRVSVAASLGGDGVDVLDEVPHAVPSELDVDLPLVLK